MDEKETLKLFRPGLEPQTIDLKAGMGYEFEIRAFVDEILSGKASNLNLLKQAAETIAIVEAEKISIETCSVEAVKA